MANKKINPGIPLLDTKPKNKKVIVNMSSVKENIEPTSLKEVIEDTEPKSEEEVEFLTEQLDTPERNDNEWVEKLPDPIAEEGNFEELGNELEEPHSSLEGDGVDEGIVTPPKPIFTGSLNNSKASVFNYTTRHDGGIHF